MDQVHDGLSILSNFMIDVTTCMLMLYSIFMFIIVWLINNNFT
jgi:hypothetical protein